MGRSSRFAFPMPGRKHSSSKDTDVPPPKTPLGPSGHGGMSKAQRILGTDNDLNIDAPPSRGESRGRYAESKSSGISISVSDTSESTGESGSSVRSSKERQWDRESGVFPTAMFPRPPSNRPTGKASSTLLGNRYGDDAMTTTSGITGRLRNEDSSSTLKSYYDRQKQPLAVSQQTSASSARDLALRKGYPPVVQRSPLLQVQTPVDYDSKYAEKRIISTEEGFYDKEKKKPGKLDLSRLFARGRKHHGKDADAASISNSTISMSTDGSRTPGVQQESGPKKLKKKASKESMQSQNYSVRSAKQEARKTNGTLMQLYDNYEHLPVRPSHMEGIPESGVLGANGNGNGNRPPAPRLPRGQDQFLSPTESNQPFSWKNVRSSMIVPPWETSSAASVSSRNTKTSRRTGSSTMSHSDLKQTSVLSLSESDSDEEDDDLGSISSKRITNGKNSQPGTSPSHQPRDGNLGRKGSTHSHYLELPKNTPNPRLSGPWSPPAAGKFDPSRTTSKADRRMSSMTQASASSRASRQSSSMASKRSSQATPPLSPSSVEFRQDTQHSSRFMAVTKQEEQLLEALRQKRARMREEIIEEHETAKTPPQIPARSASRFSSTSSMSQSTIRASNQSRPISKQTVLLYLDTPIEETQSIDTGEPSPDLSGFMDFGSDDDSTPRGSWMPGQKQNGNGRPRPDSSVSPIIGRGSGGLRMGFPSPAPTRGLPVPPRLSAVGAGKGGFTRAESKRRGGDRGVRFAVDAQGQGQNQNQGERQSVNGNGSVNGRVVQANGNGRGGQQGGGGDFLMDEDEREGIWGM